MHKQIVEKPTERYQVVPRIILTYDYNLVNTLIVQFQKISIPTPRMEMGNSEEGGRGVFSISRILRESTKLNWKFHQ